MSEKRVAVMTGSEVRKFEPYMVAVRLAGLEPVENPETLDGVEGVVLAGGTDVNPLLYGEERGPKTNEPDDPRDAREMKLLHEALRADVPVLAICRGLQLLNVAQGGTLVQHIENNAHAKGGVDDAHAIAIEPSSKLADVIGACEYVVNSRHHQAVCRIGQGLRVTARCPSDEIVEALELPTHRFAVAVQWHPEDRCAVRDGDRRLFEALARAIAENRR